MNLIVDYLIEKNNLSLDDFTSEKDLFKLFRGLSSGNLLKSENSKKAFEIFKQGLKKYE